MIRKRNLVILSLSIVIVSASIITVSLVLLFQREDDNGTTDPDFSGEPFTTVWNTTKPGVSGNNQVRLPLESSGNYYFLVDWGDGTDDIITSWNQAEVIHTYGLEGVYVVNITGTIIGWRFDDGGDCAKLIEIMQWGVLGLGNSGSYFAGCYNLNITATDILNLTGTTTLESAFEGCSKLNKVESMNDWDVSSVTNMAYMFQDTENFNQNISAWDVSSVTTMEVMFERSRKFNQDISGWDVSIVTSMRYMFGSTDSFNQDISGWDVSQVTNMMYMFFNTHNFNQDIGDWDVSNVLSMDSMFFAATSFNQDIGDWNVSNVVNMFQMFSNAFWFNQNISCWDVSSVTTMWGMFNDAGMFNQDLGSWNVSKVAVMTNMFKDVTLSTPNYDSLLIGWSSLPSLQGYVNFHGGNSKYNSTTIDERQILIDVYNWTITDGGVVT